MVTYADIKVLQRMVAEQPDGTVLVVPYQWWRDAIDVAITSITSVSQAVHGPVRTVPVVVVEGVERPTFVPAAGWLTEPLR